MLSSPIYKDEVSIFSKVNFNFTVLSIFIHILIFTLIQQSQIKTQNTFNNSKFNLEVSYGDADYKTHHQVTLDDNIKSNLDMNTVTAPADVPNSKYDLESTSSFNPKPNPIPNSKPKPKPKPKAKSILDMNSKFPPKIDKDFKSNIEPSSDTVMNAHPTSDEEHTNAPQEADKPDSSTHLEESSNTESLIEKASLPQSPQDLIPESNPNPPIETTNQFIQPIQPIQPSTQSTYNSNQSESTDGVINEEGEIDNSNNNESLREVDKDSTPSFGSVKSITDLKQIVGNPKPTYSLDDRLKKREGLVVFLAYVNNNGSISKIILKKSSSHINLDQRAQEALSKWKFYPGQQGWVEVPFNWTLKGGTVEKPALLRTRNNK